MGIKLGRSEAAPLGCSVVALKLAVREPPLCPGLEPQQQAAHPYGLQKFDLRIP